MDIHKMRELAGLPPLPDCPLPGTPVASAPVVTHADIFNSTTDRKVIVQRFQDELKMSKVQAYTTWHDLKTGKSQ